MAHDEHHAAKTLGIGKAIAVLTSGGDAQGKGEGTLRKGGECGRPGLLSFLTPLAVDRTILRN